ncbi:MAG: winged helix-turn-helix domain-containing protein [Burkholderiales bacterium]
MDATYTFGRYEMRTATRELVADGQPLPIGGRAFDLLHVLVDHRDRLMTKNELLDLAWPGVVVEENNLQVQISTLRKLLGPQAIVTIPGRGYRFVAALDAATGVAPAAGTALTAAPVALPPRATARTNLPADLPRLFGRADELAALDGLVRAHKLVTVVGAGGIGKSRLAQAAAARAAGHWSDGAWMVELAGLAEPALIATTIARELSLPNLRTGTADELACVLAERSLLLVLDNCEHLLDAVAGVVRSILAGARGVTILATSQEPLRLPDEQQYRIAPLAVPEAGDANARDFGAVALFEARVRAVDPRFALRDEDLPLASDICRRLDGLPLAVELAAARVGTLGLRAVCEKLDARFRLLTGGARATLRRHQTLRAALEWSCNLLTPDEQAVFRRLGIFAGGFTMEMAQQVASDERLDEWAVLDHLSALVEKSLVVADPGPVPRYRLLESARAFALEALAVRETATILERHARAMRAFLERLDDANLDCEIGSQAFAAQALPELPNLRAAHAWAAGDGGDAETALALAAHAGAIIDYTRECIAWLTSIPREEVDAAPPALAARYWRALAANNTTSFVPRTLQREAAQRAYDLYAALGMDRRAFGSLLQIVTHTRFDEPATADRVLAQARAMYDPRWPAELHIRLLRAECDAARRRGLRDEAIARHRETLRASVATGDWRLEAIAWGNTVDVLWQFGALEEAAREALTYHAALRARPATDADMGNCCNNALGILCELGRLDETLPLAREALVAMRRSGVFFLEQWAHFFWLHGQPERAARMIGAAEAEAQRSGTPQVNEKRMLERARAALMAALPPADWACLHDIGTALTRAQIADDIAAGLAA